MHAGRQVDERQREPARNDRSSHRTFRPSRFFCLWLLIPGRLCTAEAFWMEQGGICRVRQEDGRRTDPLRRAD